MKISIYAPYAKERFETARQHSILHPERMVASLDRKRLGQTLGASGISIRGVFDEETRRKPLAFAADAVRYGI